jgi:putative NADH-flavin reductase
MKIIVFGGTGKTGQLFIQQALEKGHEVLAYVRNASKMTLTHPHLKVLEGRLNDKIQLKNAINGADAVVSTLGGPSLFKHNQPVIDGIKNIIEVMDEVKVKRLLYMSSFGAGESRAFMPQPTRFIILDLILRVPLADHNQNEAAIKKSDLDWTIVRPGGLSDGPLTQKLNAGSEKTIIRGNVKISRANVAHFMLNQVNDLHYNRQGVWLFE